MTALTEDRLTSLRTGEAFGLPVAAATTIYAGSIVGVNASGYAIPFSASAVAAVGVARGRVENTGANGDATVVVDRRGALLANSAGADAVTNADAGQVCYAVDDQTVTRTPGASPKPAGTVLGVEAGGQVWVDFSAAQSAVTAQRTVDVTLSVAQVLALNATPVQVIAAPGAGLAIVIDHVISSKAAGIAYADIAAGDDLALKYTNGSGAALLTLEATGYLDQATAQARYMPATVALAPVANAAVVAHMTGTEITTGDSPVKLRIAYRVIPTVL